MKIHGEMVTVNAQIAQLHSMSAHADSAELLRWLGGMTRPPKLTCETALTFGATIRDRLGWSVVVPEYLEAVELP